MAQECIDWGSRSERWSEEEFRKKRNISNHLVIAKLFVNL